MACHRPLTADLIRGFPQARSSCSLTSCSCRRSRWPATRRSCSAPGAAG